MAVLDTPATVKKFIKFGFPEAQAEVMTEVMNNQNKNLVTKTDLTIVEGRLKASIKDVESKLKPEISTINTNIKWLIAIVLVILGILLKNMF
jgi:hypothetical protein